MEGIKKGCKYYGIIDKASGEQAVTYSCPQLYTKVKLVYDKRRIEFAHFMI